ncbi:type II toxin-antitoxin system VapC family toxin [Nostoc sp. FACHB-892]|uniref:type II toxin-antitoxin system VapC family toxin n=1 Tax=Nostoc sp. FACHB-892 TaxID=2692843 RepID=UPI001F55A1F3|nr:PIN domain-containing protein [Nostoc sp. FACHB-892]
MNRLLLDTHAFIWFVSNDATLPVLTREKIESAEAVFFSIASVWEMAIKLNIGKLSLQGAFEEIEPKLTAAGITIDSAYYLYRYSSIPLFTTASSTSV